MKRAFLHFAWGKACKITGICYNIHRLCEAQTMKKTTMHAGATGGKKLMIEIGNTAYFLFWAGAAALFTGIWLLLRRTSEKTQRTALFVWLLLNFLLHFFKQLLPGYELPRDLYKSTAENICAVSTLAFPFLFLTRKESSLHDFMFFIGIAGGLAAFLDPTEAVGKTWTEPEVWRFYFCHFTLFSVPMLTAILDLRRPKLTAFWKIPLLFLALEAVVLLNEALLAAAGQVSSDPAVFFYRGHRNHALVFGPKPDMGTFGSILSAVVPGFMKKDIFGIARGADMYWPVVWLLIPGYVFLAPLYAVLCLPFLFGKKRDQ